MRLLPALPLLLASALAAPPAVYVAYPPDPYRVAFDHVLLEGHVPAGASLSVNGQPAPVGPDGLFILWQPLKRGVNALQLASRLGGETGRRTVTVTSAPPAPLPARPTAILAGSLTPDASENLYTLPPTLETRTLTVRFQGSPGGRASFMLGTRGPFPMAEAAAGLPGRYAGSYVLQPGDRFDGAAVRVSLRGTDGRTVQATAPGRLTFSERGPRVGEESVDIPGRGVNAATTVWRNGPAGSFLLFPRTGVHTVVVGEVGDSYLLRLSAGLTARVPKTQLRLLPEGSALPDAAVSGLSTRVTPGASEVRLELSERVPFTLEQTGAPGDQHLDLRLYHAHSSLDDAASALPDPLISDLRWVQDEDGVTRLRVSLNTAQQWGFDATYQGTTLVLRLRHAPAAPAVPADQPLAGRRILVDPGHGGSEKGAVGALGVNEKDLNLSIARLLVARLNALGAQASLTRDSDVTLGLYARDLQAEALGAELLVSIHGNALPDGADPGQSRGSGAYYYWPQARPLVDHILRALASGLPEAGLDGAHLQNLALTRPSTQLSVLVETAFLTDPGNLRLLMSPDGQSRFAAAIAQGIADFYAGAR